MSSVTACRLQGTMPVSAATHTPICLGDYLFPDMAPSEGQAASQKFTSVCIFQFQELGIKQPLHRKKLILAVKAINTKQEEKSALLDHIWVTRKEGQCACMHVPGSSRGKTASAGNVCLQSWLSWERHTGE